MISFKEFINEDWKLWQGVRKYPTRNGSYAHNFKNIDGHKVVLELSGTEHRYQANYSVDDSYDKKRISPQTGRKILHHVGRSIDSFVRHTKPKSITMSSQYENRMDLHSMVTRKLARKYNGNVSVTHGPNLTHHTVEFPEH
tara:strand:- start:759 stop:1181 length:423 start_codon:yes stop_codon:yes gene_type:complete